MSNSLLRILFLSLGVQANERPEAERKYAEVEDNEAEEKGGRDKSDASTRSVVDERDECLTPRTKSRKSLCSSSEFRDVKANSYSQHSECDKLNCFSVRELESV